MKQKVRLNGTLKAYLRWPVYLSLILIGMTASIFMVDVEAGFIMSVYLVMYILGAVIIYYRKRSTILREIVQYAMTYNCVQNNLARQMVTPYGVLDCEGHLLWGNDEFLDIIQDEKAAKRGITNIFPEIYQSMFPSSKTR